MIPDEVLRNNPVLMEANQNGLYSFDGVNNDIHLPSSPDAARAARDQNWDGSTTVHNGPHDTYSNEVGRIAREELARIDTADAAQVQQAIENINERARALLTDPLFIDANGRLI